MTPGSTEFQKAVIVMLLCSPSGALLGALPSQENFEGVLSDFFGPDWRERGVAPANFWNMLQDSGANDILDAASRLFAEGWGTGEHPPSGVQTVLASYARTQDHAFLAGYSAGFREGRKSR